MADTEWDRAELVAAFKALGARDPEGWAASQAEEGLRQLHRFAFLKSLWAAVLGDTGPGWVESVIGRDNELPDDAAAEALKRMRAAGVADEDVMKVVRAARAEQVFFVADLVDDPGSALSNVGHDRVESDVRWGLFTADEDGNPQSRIDGLHESVDDVGRSIA